MLGQSGQENQRIKSKNIEKGSQMRISKHMADRLGDKVRVNLCGWLRIWSADCFGSKKIFRV